MINPDSTAERRAAVWVQLLTLWKTNNLPSPESIDAGSGAVWLPPNERGQVDAWGAALGLRPATVGPAGPLLSGKERTSTYYSANDGAGRLSVMCNLSLGDASDHWSPTKEAALSALESALASTTEHLTAEPAPATPADLTAAFPADPHVTAAMELTPTGQLAEPVTVSPERVAEIPEDRLNAICDDLTDLESDPDSGEHDFRSRYIDDLPELDDERTAAVEPDEAPGTLHLLDGTRIIPSSGGVWMWSR